MNVYTWALSRIEATRRAAPLAGARMTKTNLLRALILVTVLGIVGTVIALRDTLDFNQVGYPAIAALSFLASASLVVPVPGMASVCTGGWLLNPVLVALVAGSAETVGELTGYALGASGQGVVSKGKLYARMERWMSQRGWLVLFVLSLVPNPIFDFAGVAAGALRYPISRFLLVIWPGKFLKFLMIAYACSYGVDDVLKFF